MSNKKPQQVLRRKLKTVPLKPQIESLIKCVNLLPDWLELPVMKSRTNNLTNFFAEFYNSRDYENVTDGWLKTAVSELSDLALLPYLAEKFSDEKLHPLKLLRTELKKDLSNPNSPNQVLSDQLKEVEIEIGSYEKRLKNIEMHIDNFQNYVLKDFKDLVVNYEGFDFLEHLKKDYDSLTIKQHIYESVRRMEKFLMLKWHFDDLIRNLVDHPSNKKLFVKSKRKVSTKQFDLFMKYTNSKPRPVVLSFVSLVGYLVDEDGIAQPKINEFYAAIIGEDVRRIRKCLYCGDIFWAGRIDKFCCSTECNRAENLILLPPLSDEARLARNQRRIELYNLKKYLQEKAEKSKKRLLDSN